SCGLAPGKFARTEMVGKSTCGSGETGSLKYATAPAAANPIVSSVVATGRRMNGVDGPMLSAIQVLSDHGSVRLAGLAGGVRADALRPAAEADREAVEPEI